MSVTTLDPAVIGDLQRTQPNAQVIATDLVASAKRLGKTFPAVAHLTAIIQDILPETHLKGASVLKLAMLDQDFTLIDGNYFDADQDGKLDPLEINYPKGSKYWWRASTISPADDGTLTLTLIDRVADDMMNSKGPFKANRAKMTRAEFLKLVAARGSREARFHSEQLHKKEPIDPIDVAGTDPSSKTSSGKKTVGLGANAKPGGKAGGAGHYKGLMARGVPIGDRQAASVNILLSVAHQNNAGPAATTALVYAGIWESNLEQSSDNGRYWGVLAASHSNFAQTDTKGMAAAFLLGGKGFQSGGAISLERSGVTNPVEIAVKVEVPSIWPDNAYAKESGYPGDQAAAAEAEAIVQGGGGAAGGGVGPGTTVETVQPYYFQIGTSQAPGESDWDGSQRIAQEVNWEYFTDGPDVYYDADTTLIKQKPSAVIHRKDPIVAGWNYDNENRNIATQFTLSLYCDPFQFRAGEVLILLGFGCDKTTTAKLPGRWLIADGVRQARSMVTQFTLVQPSAPKNEPAPQTSTATVGAASSALGSSAGGVTNPAPGSTPGRLDMGKDGNYGSAGLIAPYDGVVHVIPGGPGWPGDGDYIWIKNNDQSGPDYTRAMYFAEGAVAVVGSGSKVTAGTKIGQPVAHGGTGAPGNFEIGPAQVGNGDCLVKVYGLGSAKARATVLAFEKWLVAAGMAPTNNTSSAGSP